MQSLKDNKSVVSKSGQFLFGDRVKVSEPRFMMQHYYGRVGKIVRVGRLTYQVEFDGRKGELPVRANFFESELKRTKL